MMILNKKTLFLLLFTFTIVGCNAQKKTKKASIKKQNLLQKPKKDQLEYTLQNTTLPNNKEEKNTILLKFGENIFHKEGQFNITFINVVQDSRCPKNTKCLVPGNATVALEIMSVHSRPQRILLCTEDTENAKKTVSIFNSEITLETIEPEFSSQDNVEKLKNKYQIKLKIIPNKK